MKELFLISGIGADRRVFDLLDLTNYKVTHLAWLDPAPKETIEAYALRLSKGITAEKPILIGVSFGGMMAVEIGKIMQIEKIIQISSAKTCDDMPSNILTRNLSLHLLIPSFFVKKPNGLLFWLFGVTTEKDKTLLGSIMNDMDIKFFRWAMGTIATWKNRTKLNNVVTLHGTQDKVIPYTTADYTIEGGGHLMIINRVPEIDAILKDILQ